MAKELLSVEPNYVIDQFNNLGGKDLSKPECFSADGLHPSAKGSELMA